MNEFAEGRRCLYLLWRRRITPVPIPGYSAGLLHNERSATQSQNRGAVATGSKVHSPQLKKCHSTPGSRQRLTLLVLNVHNRCYESFMGPKPSLAPLSNPESFPTFPATCFSHLPCGICLERIKNYFRIAISCHNGMNMVRPCIKCPQIPFANSARLANCGIDRCSAARGESGWRPFERALVVLFPATVWGNQGSAVTVMKPVNRTS